MAKNRKLLRVGTPIKLSKLTALLDAVDADDPDNTIVLHYNGELIVEEPQPTLATVDTEEI